MSEKNNIKKLIPEYIYRAGDILIANGYDAYLVGGALRDIIIGRKPKDFDLATNALPEQIENIFPKTVNTNAHFGTILAIMQDDTGENFDVEITTYRKEEEYIKGRWPSKVEFTPEIVEDLSRRDFTINAMALNLAVLSKVDAIEEEFIVDPFNGQDDLKNQIIRAVRDPKERFSEDGLRAFKACRLASELGFVIDPDTFAGIKKSLNVAKQISIERIRDEFIKMLKYSVKPSVGIELMRESGLLGIFVPELLETVGLTQPEWHTDDVYTHTLKTVDLAEDSIKVAALLHDLGKARTRSEDEKGVHFYGHDLKGAEMAREILTRLRFPKSSINRVVRLVRWHMFYYPSADWRKDNELEKIDSSSINEGGWTDSAIRRFIKNVGGEDIIDDLFKLRIADATSNSKTQFNPIEIEKLQERIARIREEDMALKVTDLEINGHDLIKLGIKDVTKIGRVLNELLEEVVDNPELNNKADLLELSSELINKIELEK